MDPINDIVATNLKRLREERRMSLDMVASATGVSKSMLGQIERGEVNPTIATVWKIANGLKLSFTELLYKKGLDVETVKIKEIRPLLEDGGKYRNYPVFPFDDGRRFETYFIELDPGSVVEAEPHPIGTEEFITLFSGELSIEVDEKEITVSGPSAARFRADRPHTYRNTGEELCQLSMIIYYPDNMERKTR